MSFSRFLQSLLFVFSLLISLDIHSKETITFLTWPEYIDPEIVEEFEKEFDAEVVFEYFNSDEEKLIRLASAGNSLHDVAIISGIDFPGLIKLGWLDVLSNDEIPNKALIDQTYYGIFPDVENYSVPYFWGTLGIAYREDLVSKVPTSWLDIYQPPEGLKQSIGMVKSARDLVGTALLALGYSSNDFSPEALHKVEQLIYQQIPYVHTYEYADLTEASLLVSGEVKMSLIYNGDVLMLQEYEPSIKFSMPKEGGNLWVDYLVVLSGARNKKLAKEFINFLNRPEIAARNAEFVYYGTPNRAAMELTSDGYRKNPIIFPSEDELKKSEIYYNPPTPKAIRKMNSIGAALPDI